MSKVVWITGCASGLGQHLANAFVQRGYRVVATDIDYQSLERYAEQMAWPDTSVMCRALDVTQLSQWQQLLEEVLACWHQVDLILNVAGYLKPGFAHETSFSEIDRHIDINVKGVMYGSQLMARQMVVQGQGHIINIASMASLAAIPGLTLYSASKFAVRAFSLAMAEELKGQGVKVSVICPDAIQTPMLDLQEDYQEAAMTFSGGKPLTVDDLEKLVFETVIPKAPRESLIPLSRGILAKLGNCFPGLSSVLATHLTNKGLKAQKRRKT